mmetsp:Transcript_10560/g.31134  ORF Transcript_10560/g.31134 Transcript_10560/m.31134 type:complete len:201 (-) Transcript_10560:138-740(-)
MCPPAAVRRGHRRRCVSGVGDEAGRCFQCPSGWQEGGKEGKSAQEGEGEEGEGRRAAAGPGSQKSRAPAQNPGQEEPVAAQRRRVEADLQEQPARGLEAEVLGDVRPERMGALGLPLQVQPREREAVHVRERHRRLRATVRRDAQVGLRHHVRDRLGSVLADRDLGLLVDARRHGREPHGGERRRAVLHVDEDRPHLCCW